MMERRHIVSYWGIALYGVDWEVAHNYVVALRRQQINEGHDKGR